MRTEHQVIIGTSGHIDHGKTTLVRQMTGMDADRWEEEKRRGITIDIGFAHLAGDSVTLSFIDVPGHKDFVTNMLAGIHSIDFGMLIVAADESVMPQTREHLAILSMLNIQPVVPVMTRIDLADEDIRELTELEIRELYQQMGFPEPDEIFQVDSISGTGIEELQTHLFQLAEKIRNHDEHRPTYLHVDRSFTMKGHGTVITGTLMAGSLATGDRIHLHPGGGQSVIKQLNNHGEAVDRVSSRKRVALNLPQLDRNRVIRGMIATTDSVRLSSRYADVWIRLPWEEETLEDLTRVRIAIGSDDIVARIKLLESDRLKLPGEGLAQLRFEREVACFSGEPFIIRSYSPVRTIGGGEILDPRPPKRRGYRKACEALKHKQGQSESQRLLGLLEENRWLDVEDARGRLFLAPDPFHLLVKKLEETGQLVIVQAGKLLAHPDAIQEAEQAVLETIALHHEKHPRDTGLPAARLQHVHESIIRKLESDGRIRRYGPVLALTDFNRTWSADEDAAYGKLLEELKDDGLTPTLVPRMMRAHRDPELLQDLLGRALEEDRIVRISSEYVVAKTVFDAFLNEFREWATQQTDFGIQEVKARFPLARKYLVPLLEHLDGEKITVKQGDRRRLIR